MRRALTISRYALAFCIAGLALLWVVPLIVSLLGLDIQAWKWPVVFYGGALLMLTGPVALICVILQIAALVIDKRSERHG